MTDGVIASNFASVAAGAESIVNSAKSISSMLEDFHGEVTRFVDQHWEGAANEAFATLQAQWNQKTTELTGVLNSAANTVISGNENMQATDAKNASMFGG